MEIQKKGKILSFIIASIILITSCASNVKAFDFENVKYIEVIVDSLTMNVDQKQKVSLKAYSEEGNILKINDKIEFKSENNNVVRIINNNELVAINEGCTQIKTFYKNRETSIQISVFPNVKLSKGNNGVSIKWSRGIDNISLKWTSYENFNQYSILRKSSNESDFKEIAPKSTGNIFIDKDVNIYDEYIYKIKLFNDTGEENLLNEVLIPVQQELVTLCSKNGKRLNQEQIKKLLEQSSNDVKKPKYTNLSLKWSIVESGLKLQWTEVSELKKYKILKKEINEESFKEIATNQEGYNFVDKNITLGKSYIYKVILLDNDLKQYPFSDFKIDLSSEVSIKNDEQNKNNKDENTEIKEVYKKDIFKDSYTIDEVIEINSECIKNTNDFSIRYHILLNSKVKEENLILFRQQVDGALVEVKNAKVNTQNKTINFNCKDPGVFIIKEKILKDNEKDSNTVKDITFNKKDQFWLNFAGVVNGNNLDNSSMINSSNKLPRNIGLVIEEKDRDYIQKLINLVCDKTYYIDDNGYVVEAFKEGVSQQKPKIYSSIIDDLTKNYNVIIGSDLGTTYYDEIEKKYKKLEFKNLNSSLSISNGRELGLITLNNKYYVKDNAGQNDLKKAYELYELLKEIKSKLTKKPSQETQKVKSKSDENKKAEFTEKADAKTSEKVQVTAGPSKAKYESISKVGIKEHLIVLAAENNDYYIEYSSLDGAERGYIEQEKVKDLVSISKEIQVNDFKIQPSSVKSNTIVYHGPSAYYKIQDTIKSSIGINILDNSREDFKYIEYETELGKKRGYILASQLNTTENNQYKGKKALNSTKVYSGENDSIYAEIGILAKDQNITVLESKNGWAYIKYNVNNLEARGFVPLENIKDINLNEANHGEIKGRVKRGVGYRQIDNLDESNGYSDAVRGSTEVKSSQSYGSSKVGSVDAYERVTVFIEGSYNSEFAYIEYSSPSGTKRGYIPRSQLLNWRVGTKAVAKWGSDTYSGPDDKAYKFVSQGNNRSCISANENVVIIAKNSGWFFVEYNTNSNTGRKRGYITTDVLTGYGTLNNIASIKNPYSYVAKNYEIVYAGPGMKFAPIGSIGSINSRATESVGVISTEDSCTYIEYHAGDKLKRGYILSPMSVDFPTNIYASGVERVKYGTSGAGRELVAYKVGNGSCAMVINFAIHGYEDAWNKDGIELVKIGEKLIQDLAAYSRNNGGLNGWSVYVIPSANPDGLLDGYTNNGPGRCTTVNGIDLNRTFETNFWGRGDARNYTGSTPLGAVEAKYLKTFIQDTTKAKVVLDIHGWENKTIGNPEIGKYFDDQFGFNNYECYQEGFFITWARAIGAKATLVELPMPAHSLAVQFGNYAEKVTNATINIVKNVRAIIDGWNLENGSWYYYENGNRIKGWKSINNKWYYMGDDYKMVTGWLKLPEAWYYLEQNGEMATGWKSLGGVWYYLNSTGRMQVGFSTIDGKTYHFNSSGALDVNTMIDGWKIDGSGVATFHQGWKEENGSWYYYESGSKATGWKQINGKWYYLNEDCKMATGWKKVDNKWYYLDNSGAMQTGWISLNGNRYYLNSSGVMLEGWATIDGKTYHFNSSGALDVNAMIEGWKTDASGVATFHQGWKKEKTIWYYYENGSKATGWKQINNKWYYLNSNGVMQTGWLQVNGKTYYLNSDGAMVEGWNTIDGKRYYFNSSGAKEVNKVIDGWSIDTSGIASQELTESDKLKKRIISVVNSKSNYGLSNNLNYDDILKSFFAWYNEYNQGRGRGIANLKETYNHLPDEYKQKMLYHWINILESGNDLNNNFLNADYYNNIPSVPKYDSSLGEITGDNKYSSKVAKDYYIKYYFPIEVVHIGILIDIESVKDVKFRMWARLVYGPNATERKESFAQGVSVGLLENTVFGIPLAIITTTELIANNLSTENAKAFAAFVARATVDVEYRDALLRIVGDTIKGLPATVQKEYDNADSFGKGKIIGSAIGIAIDAIGLTAEGIKSAAKSGKFVNVAKGAAEAVSKIKTAIKTSTDGLNNILTKIYSRSNSILDVEYAGVGRIRIKETELLEDADQICRERYAKFIENNLPEGMENVDTLYKAIDRSNPATYYTYSELKELIKKVGLSGRGEGLEAHHILEKQFADIFGVDKSDIISVAVTPQWHRNVGGLGNNLDNLISTELSDILKSSGRNSAGVKEVWEAHRNVYEKIGQSDWAKAIYELYVKKFNIPYK